MHHRSILFLLTGQVMCWSSWWVRERVGLEERCWGGGGIKLPLVGAMDEEPWVGLLSKVSSRTDLKARDRSPPRRYAHRLILSPWLGSALTSAPSRRLRHGVCKCHLCWRSGVQQHPCWLRLVGPRRRNVHDFHRARTREEALNTPVEG